MPAKARVPESLASCFLIDSRDAELRWGSTKLPISHENSPVLRRQSRPLPFLSWFCVSCWWYKRQVESRGSGQAISLAHEDLFNGSEQP